MLFACLSTILLISLHQNCFTGDTLVAAEDGRIRIDEIEVDDKVWAYDIYTGETALKEVTKVYVHEVDEILHLHTSCGDIDTTSNHPFYVIDKGWVAAGDLNDGDEVYLIDGSTAIVTGFELEKLAEPIKVYNLEVADFNTYFVGDEAVLVHNYNPPDRLDDGDKVVRGGTCKAEQFTNGSGVTTDENGLLHGVSVSSGTNKSVEELSAGDPHGKIGVTTVGQIRSMGGDVIPSPTTNNIFHCTLSGITAQIAEMLFGNDNLMKNPNRKK